VRFRFVEEQRGAFPSDRLCQVTNVSPRGLRAFRSRPASRWQRMDRVVLAPVKEQSRLSLGRDGRPRMTGNLKEGGIDAGHRRVGRLTRKNGIVAERTRKFKAPTDSDHAFNSAPNPAWIVTSRRIGPTGTEEPRSDMDGRHQLHLDPQGLAASGARPWSSDRWRTWPRSWTCTPGA
jgi:transposase InsO family protein